MVTWKSPELARYGEEGERLDGDGKGRQWESTNSLLAGISGVKRAPRARHAEV